MSNKARIVSAALSVSMLFALSGCSGSEAPSAPDFFEEHGLEITPQGHIELATTVNDGQNDVGDIVAGVDVSISEVSPSEREDYKEIICTYVYDESGCDEGTVVAGWNGAFDRYTGTSFEFYPDPDDEDSMPAVVEFDYNGRHIDVQMSYSIEGDEEAGTVTVMITVVCPEDYDGTVFQIGYSDMAIDSANGEVDYTQHQTVDGLPGFGTNGHDYYYFSASNS